VFYAVLALALAAVCAAQSTKGTELRGYKFTSDVSRECWAIPGGGVGFCMRMQ